MTSRPNRRRSRYHRLPALAAALLLLLAACGSPTEATAQQAGPTREPASAPLTSQPSTPTPEIDTAERPSSFEVSPDWPEVIRPYADFVQRTRGEAFSFVPEIVFRDPSEIGALLIEGSTTFNELTDEQRANIARIDDLYRAFGLTSLDFDVFDQRRTSWNEATAFYDWEDGTIVFPSPGGSEPATIAVADQPVLVHEMAHALQDPSRVAWSRRIQDRALALAMIEGESDWVLGRYLSQLSAKDLQVWRDSRPTLDTATDAGGTPDILTAQTSTPYLLGELFFRSRHAVDGLDGIDAVFTHGRVTSQMLLDPWLFTGKPVAAENFGFNQPPPDEGGQVVEISGDFPLTAVDWHQILAAGLPGDEALAAARSISSWSFPTVWIDEDDRTCFSVFVTAERRDRDNLAWTLRQWTEIDSATRSLESFTDVLVVGGCDPGPGNVAPRRVTASEAMFEAATVINAEIWAVEQGLAADIGTCVGYDFMTAVERDPQLDGAAWYNALQVDELSANC